MCILTLCSPSSTIGTAAHSPSSIFGTDKGAKQNELYPIVLHLCTQWHRLELSVNIHWIPIVSYCIRHIFRAQIFSRFWTKWGESQELNFAIFWCSHYYKYTYWSGNVRAMSREIRENKTTTKITTYTVLRWTFCPSIAVEFSIKIFRDP